MTEVQRLRQYLRRESSESGYAHILVTILVKKKINMSHGVQFSVRTRSAYGSELVLVGLGVGSKIVVETAGEL